MLRSRMTRRSLLEKTALTTTALVAAPYVRGAHAAGKLSIGFWDHWVPGANNASKALCEEWGEKNKVEVSIDYITSQGNKNLLTIAAEAQARLGPRHLRLPDLAAARPRQATSSRSTTIMAELDQDQRQGQRDGRIPRRAPTATGVAVPACVGSQIKGPCSRIDLMKQHAGIDVVAMYPAGAPPKADAWTLDTMLKAAEACHKGGHPFGIGLGQTEDNVDTAGAIFQSFGAELVDAEGDHHGQVRPGAASARVLQEARAVPAAGRSGLGQRLQQQVSHLRQGLADHEPAERLGGGQARRAAGRRAVLDARHAGRSEGPLCAVPAVLLGHLELQQEQVGGEEPASATFRSPPRSRRW